MPYDGPPARTLPAGLVQPDRTSCGSSVLVAAQMLYDPSYAAFVGADSPAERFRDEVLAMHRRTNRLFDATGRIQLPWPQALGTLPWALARQLSGSSGIPYDARLILPSQRPAAFHRISSTVESGPVVPLFVGNRWSARHVVLVLSTSPTGLRIYDPSRGRQYDLSRSDFTRAHLDVAGWQVPWFLIVPRG